MRRTSLIALFAVVLLSAAATSQARHRHGASWHPGWGPWWGWGPSVYVAAPAYMPGGAPDLAVVDTDVEPEHARVFLNGELIGTADDFDGFPDYLYLERGHYSLEFKLAGYQTAKVEIDARGGRFFPFSMQLKRAKGEAESPWYDRPDGLPVSRVYGPAREGERETVRARPDPELREELRGGKDVDDDEGEGESTPEPRPKAARSGAALDLRVSPANASVYLDGEFLGTAEELGQLERGAAVKAGKHRIEVLAPGHAPRSVEVDLEVGERRQVVVELERGLDKPNGGS